MGKKGKSKPKAEDYKASSSQEKGNQAYLCGDFERAVGLYTKGLAGEPENAILLANRAAALIGLHRYEEALADGLHATQADPNYAKGFFRQADALRKVDRMEESLAIVTSTIDRLGSFPELETLLSNLKEEIALELRVPLDHPERTKFRTVVQWLESGGATFPKLKMRFYSVDYRGVHSTTFIPVSLT